MQTLEKERDEKVEEKNAIHEENRKRRKVCDMWQDRLQMWDELQQVRPAFYMPHSAPDMCQL